MSVAVTPDLTPNGKYESLVTGPTVYVVYICDLCHVFSGAINIVG
jgi:hypothetical protein